MHAMADLTKLRELLAENPDALAIVAEVATELDTAKGSATAAEKARKAAETKAAALASDLETARKGADEATAAIVKERDELRAKAEQLAEARRADGIWSHVAGQLDIADPVKRARALKVLKAEGLPDTVSVDESGAVTGADAHLKAFRESMPEFWGTTGPQGNGGPAPGADGKPASGGGKLTPAEAERAAIDAEKARLAKARGLKLAGSKE